MREKDRRMPVWLVIALMVIFGVVDSCKPSNIATFEVTPQEFIKEYNSDVSADLRVYTFKSGVIASVDENNQFGNLNKYTLDFSRDSKSGKMNHLNLYYNFSREPGGQPTAEGMRKMTEFCVASIDAIDDGWLTSGDSILQSLGFYANKDGWQEYKKNGIKYRFDRDSNAGVIALSMEAIKE